MGIAILLTVVVFVIVACVKSEMFRNVVLVITMLIFSPLIAVICQILAVLFFFMLMYELGPHLVIYILRRFSC